MQLIKNWGIATLFGLTVAMAALVPASSEAAMTITGKVTFISVFRGGWATVFLDTTATSGFHTCVGSNNRNNFSFDTSTAHGKAVLSLVTSAKLAGQTVRIVGDTGGCCGQSGMPACPSSPTGMSTVEMADWVRIENT